MQKQYIRTDPIFKICCLKHKTNWCSTEKSETRASFPGVDKDFSLQHTIQKSRENVAAPYWVGGGVLPCRQSDSTTVRHVFQLQVRSHEDASRYNRTNQKF
jgi:hypothetical protein